MQSLDDMFTYLDSIRPEGKPATHHQKIAYVRNDLCLWALGRNPIALSDVELMILALDWLLQQVDL